MPALSLTGSLAKIIPAVLLAALLHPCSAQDSAAVRRGLSGEWRWFRSAHTYLGSGSTETTPADCRCSKKLVFRKGQVSLYKGDTLTGRSPFSIREVRFMEDPVRYVLSSKDLNDDVSISGDTLVVGTPGNCGTLEYYKKVRSGGKKSR
jgi:hypothetical protein